MNPNNINISVREMAKSDIDQFLDYWFKSDDDFLIGMGVDLSKLPIREEMANTISEHIVTPLEKKSSYYLIWEVDNTAIGHTNVNQIELGKQAFMHIHLWRKDIRRQGMGTELIKKSLPFYFNNLHLKQLICEPYLKNEAPHKTLKKLGFEFQKKYITKPGPLSSEQEVNRWCMTREIFDSLFTP